jgi:cobalt-zinc-cadmium efflux system membrane fusion protein
MVIVVPPLAGFYSYISGRPLNLVASAGEVKEIEGRSLAATDTGPHLALVPGQPHTLDVPEQVAASLGIRRGPHDTVAIARAPAIVRPLVLTGSTRLDPTRLARIRARFAPVRVVRLGQVEVRNPKTGQTEFREVRAGDHVKKGDLLGMFYSVDVGTKKNALLDALVQLDLDQRILDDYERNRGAVPKVIYNTQATTVQHDRNAINQALNNLRAWDVPQEEIDELHDEAKKLCADKDAWSKTREGRWVRGEKPAGARKPEAYYDEDNPWGRVTIRAPFDGVVVERTVHAGEPVMDPTVNLFQIADVRRFQVIARCREEDVPLLEALHGRQRQWVIRTVGTAPSVGLTGPIDQISYLIDPNDHTAVVTGYVENPGEHMRGGQYITATVDLPAPKGVVEIPTDALIDDGKQSVVFVQPGEAKLRFTMHRVEVLQRFESTVFVRATPFSKEERLTAEEAREGLLPREPLTEGARVLLAGSVELKAALLDRESEPEVR